MRFADEYREYQQWKNNLQNTPEAWEAHRALKQSADFYDSDPDRYETGQDIIEMVLTLLSQQATDSYIGEVLRETYDWKALGRTDDEPE